MNKPSPIITVTILFACLGICIFCTRKTGVDNKIAAAYIASSPCDSILKTMLGIPAGTKCDQVTWNLKLFRDSQTLDPTSYTLRCVYGLSKQGSRELMPGAVTIDANGKCEKSKG